MPNRSHQPNLSNLRTRLRTVLRRGGRIAILGVGSDLRGDDAAGLLAAGLIRKACRRLPKSHSVKVFIGSTAPENFTGEIIRFAPSLVVVLDAADMGLRPGAVRLISRDRTGGFSFSTHTMPLGVLARYLEYSAGCDVILVGIQPAIIEWGAPVTAAVKAAAARVADEVQKARNTR